MIKHGLFITHIFETKNNNSPSVSFNIIGVYQECNSKKNFSHIKKKDLDSVNETNTYNHHLYIISEVNEITEDKNGIYIIEKGKKQYIYDYKKAEKLEKNEKFIPTGNICPELFNAQTIKNKIKVIKEYFGDDYFNFVTINKIKKIELIPTYKNILILLDDGTLYLDKKIYSNNVKEICYLNNARIYIIYNDNVVEKLIFQGLMPCHEIKYDKIITDSFFIAYLKNKVFDLVILGNEYEDIIVNLTLENVDDIKYKENFQEIILNTGGKEFFLPLNKPFTFES